jgi:hypothetical protein
MNYLNGIVRVFKTKDYLCSLQKIQKQIWIKVISLFRSLSKIGLESKPIH